METEEEKMVNSIEFKRKVIAKSTKMYCKAHLKPLNVLWGIGGLIAGISLVLSVIGWLVFAFDLDLPFFYSPYDELSAFDVSGGCSLLLPAWIVCIYGGIYLMDKNRNTEQKLSINKTLLLCLTLLQLITLPCILLYDIFVGDTYSDEFTIWDMGFLIKLAAYPILFFIVQHQLRRYYAALVKILYIYFVGFVVILFLLICLDNLYELDTVAVAALNVYLFRSIFQRADGEGFCNDDIVLARYQKYEQETKTQTSPSSAETIVDDFDIDE